MLIGTAMAATIRVSLIAASASGSISASRAICQPCASASENTVSNGMNRNSAMKPMARTDSTIFTSG